MAKTREKISLRRTLISGFMTTLILTGEKTLLLPETLTHLLKLVINQRVLFGIRLMPRDKITHLMLKYKISAANTSPRLNLML